MLISTGYSLDEVGKMSVIGTKDGNKVRSVIGLYVKDVFSNERVYDMKATDAAKILKVASSGSIVDLSSYRSVKFMSIQNIAANGWVELTFDEVTHFSRVESKYNFNTEQF